MELPKKVHGASAIKCLSVPLLVLIVTILAPAAFAQLTESHARISFEAGNGMIKGSADSDWSFATINTLVLPGDTLWVDKTGMMELETSGGIFVRLADGCKADVVGLPPSGSIRGWVGSFYVQRVRRSSGDLTFSTPVGDIMVDPDSEVRIDIDPNGATTTSCHWGHATVVSPGAAGLTLGEGQRCYTEPGYLPSEPVPFNPSDEDPFDAWNRERAKILVEGEESLPPAVQTESAPVGTADLATYGNWVTVDNTPCWQPLVADYVPYRQGRWSYMPAYGYCWVDDYPFAYVTSHYGRWRHHPEHGWLWSYQAGWGPAWVASFHCGDNFVWSPLDPFDRPVVYSEEYYSIGDMRFGIYASSFCPAARILGYGGPMVVCQPLTPFMARNFRHGDINVWNININTGGHGHHGYDSIYERMRVPVRDFTPRRVMRGPEERHFDSDHGGRAERAHERVAGLERTDWGRRSEFRLPDAAKPRDTRTSAAQVTRMRPRKVDLQPQAIERVQERARAAAASSPDAKRSILRSVTPNRQAATAIGEEPTNGPSIRKAPTEQALTSPGAAAEGRRLGGKGGEVRTRAPLTQQPAVSGTPPTTLREQPRTRTRIPESPKVQRQGDTMRKLESPLPSAPSTPAPPPAVRERTRIPDNARTIAPQPQNDLKVRSLRNKPETNRPAVQRQTERSMLQSQPSNSYVAPAAPAPRPQRVESRNINTEPAVRPRDTMVQPRQIQQQPTFQAPRETPRMQTPRMEAPRMEAPRQVERPAIQRNIPQQQTAPQIQNRGVDAGPRHVDPGNVKDKKDRGIR